MKGINPIKSFVNTLLVVSFLWLASGCEIMAAPVPDPLNTPVQTVDKMATVMAIASPEPSATQVPPMVEPTATPTETVDPPAPTPTREPVYQQVCLPVQNPPPDSLPQDGVIVLGGSQARLYNLKTLGHPAIPLGGGSSNFQFLLNVAAVSPNGKEFM
jgi:hypothetical protein